MGRSLVNQILIGACIYAFFSQIKYFRNFFSFTSVNPVLINGLIVTSQKSPVNVKLLTF